MDRSARRSSTHTGCFNLLHRCRPDYHCTSDEGSSSLRASSRSCSYGGRCSDSFFDRNKLRTGTCSGGRSFGALKSRPIRLKYCWLHDHPMRHHHRHYFFLKSRFHKAWLPSSPYEKCLGSCFHWPSNWRGDFCPQRCCSPSYQ